ncbi:11028_t:CDS:2 [Racocetra fulgida]|uniref:11028_t:CDS:1 n=1 Tax=Racocetra fulgida TaxID=60492 RepID=A0A9N8ZRT4_9GLOM|nr:11028_t:CDS:2 [Racocetra fulgida]
MKLNPIETEIKKQFLESDKNKPEPIEQEHPQHMYTSKLINTQEIIDGLTNVSMSKSIEFEI